MLGFVACLWQDAVAEMEPVRGTCMGSDNKILVVDDEVVIRELMTDLLSDDGYRVETAPCGARALEMLERDDEFAVLFTDIMMPGMDGIELIREARRIRPALITIVMTGFATLETARAAVKEGAYDYVVKPFTLSDIKLAVVKALDRQHLMNENARLLELTELFNISETIAGIHDERKLLDFVLRAALNRVGADRGSLMVTTEDGKALEVAASIGLPDEAAETLVPIGQSISGMVAERAQALLVENIRNSPEIKRLSRNLGDHSFVSVPLERRFSPEQRSIADISPNERVLAVLNVTKKRDGESFSERDLKILSIMANHAAVALQNVRLINHIEETHLATLQSMALLLEAKDAYTHGHSERVRDYCMLAARKLGLSEHDIGTLWRGAALHDIGKIGVLDAVLNKVARLTDEEYAMIQRHPQVGYEVLAPVPLLTADHLALVRSHHERIDGTGYPDGVSGDNVSDLARIIGVADAYDAMSSDRAYRQAMPPEKIIAEIERCSGSQFDARIAKLFIEAIQNGELAKVSAEPPPPPTGVRSFERALR